MWHRRQISVFSSSRMFSIPRSFACTLAVAGATLVASQGVLAQQQQDDEQAPDPQTLFVFDYAGGTALFESPKDDGLKRALGMIPARFYELRDSEPDLQEIPKPIVDMIFKLSTYPMRMAATDRGIDPNTGMPGIGVVASWKMTGADPAKDARAFHGSVTGLMLQAGGGMQINPSQIHDGFSELALPFGALSFGPREANDGWRYEILFGLMPDSDEPFDVLPAAPRGSRAVFRGSLDLAAWTPIVQMFGGMAMMMIPNGTEIMKDLHERGITGPDAMAFEVMSGYRGNQGFERFVARRMKHFAPSMGIPLEPLDPDVYSVVPSDATMAQIKRADLGFIWQQLKKQIEMGAPGQLDTVREEFTKHTGLDIEADLIEPLGSTHAFYLSDSTGGGSFLSAVMVMWLDDAPRMRASLAKLTNKFNEAIKSEIDGPFAIRFASFDQGGVHFIQLRTPGLPIPLEPTFAIAGDKFIAAATPQACLAAAAQAQGRLQGDLRTNSAFKAANVSLDTTHSFMFVDSKRTLRTAYPYATLLGSALSNAVRSHTNDAREPGLVVPPYAILAMDAKPMVTVGHWEGEDYVLEITGDSSMLVNACGILGVGDLAPLLTGGLLGGGITAGIMEQTRGNRHQPAWTPSEDSNSESHDRGSSEY